MPQEKFVGDVHAKPISTIRKPEFNRDMARFLVELGLAGEATAEWLTEELCERFEGKIVMPRNWRRGWFARRLVRDASPMDPQTVAAVGGWINWRSGRLPTEDSFAVDDWDIEGEFGVSPRRQINAYKHRAHTPSGQLLHWSCLGMVMAFDVARTVWFGRHGFDHP